MSYDLRLRHEDRRLRTYRIAKRRNKQWRYVTGSQPRKPGRSKDRSPFDCGVSRCSTCTQLRKPVVRDDALAEFWREQFEIEREIRDALDEGNERFYESTPEDWWQDHLDSELRALDAASESWQYGYED